VTYYLDLLLTMMALCDLLCRPTADYDGIM
jgi:hypothetical protein